MDFHFQKIVLVIAAILLLIVFVATAYTFYTASASQVWPPYTASCPDYWIDIGDNGEKCANIHNLGTCNNIQPANMYDVIQNTNSVGNNLMSATDIDDAEMCMALCTRNQNCHGATFTEKHSTCVLKDANVTTADQVATEGTTLYLKNSGSDLNTMNFNESPFIGDGGICNKYKWAQNCSATWDGITYGVSNPCSSDETVET